MRLFFFLLWPTKARVIAWSEENLPWCNRGIELSCHRARSAKKRDFVQFYGRCRSDQRTQRTGGTLSTGLRETMEKRFHLQRPNVRSEGITCERSPAEWGRPCTALPGPGGPSCRAGPRAAHPAPAAPRAAGGARCPAAPRSRRAEGGVTGGITWPASAAPARTPAVSRPAAARRARPTAG